MKGGEYEDCHLDIPAVFRINSVAYRGLDAKDCGFADEVVVSDPRPETDIDSPQTGKGAVRRADAWTSHSLCLSEYRHVMRLSVSRSLRPF